MDDSLLAFDMIEDSLTSEVSVLVDYLDKRYVVFIYWSTCNGFAFKSKKLKLALCASLAPCGTELYTSRLQ